MMKRTVEMGFFLALALILSYVESLIPFTFGLPGMKLGLPNLMVVLLLYQRNARDAVLLNILRVILSGFLFGNLYGILYALSGAGFSFCAMLLGRRAGCFSAVGVSVLGGVFHNTGQILMAMFVVETVYVIYYLPFLIAAGTITGAVLGIAAAQIMPYLGNGMTEGQEEDAVLNS